MSKNADVESDSPMSRHDLNETKYDIILANHSVVIVRTKSLISNQNVVQTLSHSDLDTGRMELKFTPHYTKRSTPSTL